MAEKHIYSILCIKIFENPISNLCGVVHCDIFQKIVAFDFFHHLICQDLFLMSILEF